MIEIDNRLSKIDVFGEKQLLFNTVHQLAASIYMIYHLKIGKLTNSAAYSSNKIKACNSCFIFKKLVKSQSGHGEMIKSDLQRVFLYDHSVI